MNVRVQSVMEFNVSLIKIIQHGNCKPKPKHTPKQRPEVTRQEVVTVDKTYSPRRPPYTAPDDILPDIPSIRGRVPSLEESAAKSDDYLLTFIVPIVIIALMLFLASITACIFYRKRRSGKMNLQEDGRQSYGNKGIPVIFQEELEEKPETGTKMPVILKDEKPPLAPPEYSKSGSLKLNDDSEPYQPPPPFTRTQDNNRQPRPKPTPTYRKPPPYVPP